MFLLAKYNTQTDIYFPMVKRAVVDLAVTADWTPATGDTKVSKDGGAVANSSNNPAIASGASWKLTLTASELSCKWLTVQIVDSATKAVEDQFLTILTYGNASAFFIAPDYQDAASFGLSRLDAAVTSRMATFTLPTNFSSLSIDANGRVDLVKWVGSAVNALIAGRVEANAQVVGDKTGYTASTVSDKTGYSLSAAGINAIWDQLLSAITTASTIGKLIKDNLDATISSRLPTSSYTAAPTTAQIWDEAIPGTHAAGTAGAKLNSAASAGDPWSTALPGAYGAGTGGNILGNLVASIWNAVASSFNTAGSMGQKLNAAGGAADPLTNVVPGSYAAGTAGYALGTLPAGIGATSYTYTVHSGSDSGPLIGAGVTVWVTSDSAGANYVAGPLITNDLSQVTFLLNAGTYYFWRQKAGWTFSNPDQEQVV